MKNKILSREARVFLLILVIVFSFNHNLLAYDETKEVSFVDTEIHDIYYLIAKVNNLDIFILDGVEGRVTVQINNINEKNLLEDFVLANGDSFLLLEGIYYIGNKTDIDLLRESVNEDDSNNLEVETLILNYSGDWSSRWGELLDRYYPEIQWGYNELMKELILNGQLDNIARAYDFISLIVQNRNYQNINYISEIIYIPENIDFNITDIITGLESIEYKWLEIDRILYLNGEDDILEKTIKIIDEYMVNNQIIDKIYCLDYINSIEAEAKLSLIMPGLKINSFEENKIILSGKSSEINRIESILEQIDIKPEQVLVEFNVLEINEDIRTGDDLSEDLNISFGYDLIDGFNFDLSWIKFLNYAEEKGEIKSIASPSLLTLANKPSRLHIGDRVPVPKYDSDNNISGYEYIDTGIILDIVAKVNSNQEITLEIRPEISNFISHYDEIPTINTRELSTIIRLNHGETYYIAGLKQFRQQEIVRGNNILSNLPLLGWLFSNKYYEESNGQLILAITPYLVSN
ncbi:MAG: type II secretion system protein GspD [Halarsenatibacteraceae bacterium]